jgi:hypothetical protein
MTSAASASGNSGTDLVRIGGALAAKPGQTIKDFLAGLAKISEQKKFEPVLPSSVTVSEAERAALASYAEKVGKIEWPDARRELTDEERVSLEAIVAETKLLKGLIRRTEENLRGALFNDADVRVEKAGEVTDETLRDGKGFYLHAAAGKGWRRTVTAPTAALDAEELLVLDRSGQIEHADYLAATRQVRVIDEAGFLGLVKRKPHLLPILRRAIVNARAGSVSFRADPAK